MHVTSSPHSPTELACGLLPSWRPPPASLLLPRRTLYLYGVPHTTNGHTSTPPVGNHPAFGQVRGRNICLVVQRISPSSCSAIEGRSAHCCIPLGSCRTCSN